MQPSARLLSLLLVTFSSVLHCGAQSTAFAYKGQMSDGGAPPTGAYDMQFRLADALVGGNYVGSTATCFTVLVSNGWFVATLDFGASVFDGSARWLEMSVRTNGAISYSVLSPRQPITATPYAILAGSASNAVNATTAATAATAASVSGSVAASQLTGVLSASQLPSYVLTNGTANGIAAGDFYVSNRFSAGIIQTSVLAHVTGIPPAEPIVASWCPGPIIGYGTFYDQQDCAALAAFTTSNNLASVAYNLAQSGLVAGGWNTFVIDDCWMSTRVDGHLQEDATRFPGTDSLKGLVAYLHSLGYKVGIYTSFPNGTCCGRPGTGVADIENDVVYFAQCGMDLIKVDSCIFTASGTSLYELEETGTRLFVSAIHRTGRPMVLYMNYPDYHPAPAFLRYQDNVVPVWDNNASEFPRGLGIITNATIAMDDYSNVEAPGHYLFAGCVDFRNGLVDITNAVSLFAFGQDLMIGGTPSPSQMPVMTNQEVLAIASDPAVIPPKRVWDDGMLSVWIKPLGPASSSTNVVALINKGGSPANVGLTWASVGISSARTVRDILAQSTLGSFSGSFSNTIPAGAVRLYKLWPTDLRGPYSGTNTIGTTTLVIRDGLIMDVR